jgi:hypothetical protein
MAGGGYWDADYYEYADVAPSPYEVAMRARSNRAATTKTTTYWLTLSRQERTDIQEALAALAEQHREHGRSGDADRVETLRQRVDNAPAGH